MILLFHIALTGGGGSAHLLKGLALRVQGGFTYRSGTLVGIAKRLCSPETLNWSALFVLSLAWWLQDN